MNRLPTRALVMFTLQMDMIFKIRYLFDRRERDSISYITQAIQYYTLWL